MDAKITLPLLAKALIQKKKMTQKDAEAFLREFFDAIKQNVTTDKLVKIKGLGTFKLIEVLDRESINVSTGDRIVIPGHTKLSFTPDATLRDIVNKPFTDFQTVVINEGTSLEEMERIPQQEMEQEAEIVPETEQEPETAPETEQEPETAPETEQEPIPVSTPKTILDSGNEAKSKEEISAPEKEVQQSETGSNPPKNNHFILKVCALIAGIILLCLISFYAGYKIKQGRGGITKQQPPIENKVQEDIPTEQDDSIDSVSPKEQNEETQYDQVPGGEYKIVGTRKTHVMKPGDYLTKIAVTEYGDKDFTPYIIVHNRFPDPNNVPVGAEIKLPELEKME